MKFRNMKKLLVVLLVLAIIVLGVLFYMKINLENEDSKLIVNAENNEDTMNVVIEDKLAEQKSKYAGNKRTLAVMIDNVGNAVPQTGLNDAMIVYEAIVEGGLTRLMAVFKDTDGIENIGPTRSARPYFIDYALENDSIFAHYGGSPKALDEIASLKMEDIDGINVSEKIYWRTSEKVAPHNAILNVAEAWNYVNDQGYRKITTQRNVLNYVIKEINIDDGITANTVNIPYPSSEVSFRYNEETKLYERYVENNLQKDWISGDVLTAKNIIITFANNYTTDEENGYGRQAIQNIGTLDRLLYHKWYGKKNTM